MQVIVRHGVDFTLECAISVITEIKDETIYRFLAHYFIFHRL